MRRVILFLLASFVILVVAWLLAGIPGHLVASVGSYTVETSAPVAILILAILVALALVVFRLLQGILAIPGAGVSWRRHRRLKVGERAITRVLVALAAGEKGTARKEAQRARQLLGDSPQILLLVAEAGRLAGREDEAEEAFRALTKQEDARFLGFRGLLRQAVDRRDWAEALAVANQAEAAHPGTVWLREQRAELALQTDNWAEAIELIKSDPSRTTYFIAAADAEPSSSRALAYAKQAWKQDPTFPPAVLAYATRLRSAGQEKRAQSCVARAWKRVPHPELATFALALETEKLAKVQAANRLVAGNLEALESRLVLARVALDAGLTGEARHQIEIVLSEGIKQRRIYLLLAAIEEQEHGQTEAGRTAQREALRNAADAEADPHWQCVNCHADYMAWQAKCGVCGRIGTVQWVVGAVRSGMSVLAN